MHDRKSHGRKKTEPIRSGIHSMYVSIMVIRVVKFSREGYNMRYIFWPKSIATINLMSESKKPGQIAVVILHFFFDSDIT